MSRYAAIECSCQPQTVEPAVVDPKGVSQKPTGIDTVKNHFVRWSIPLFTLPELRELGNARAARFDLVKIGPQPFNGSHETEEGFRFRRQLTRCIKGPLPTVRNI